MIHCIESTGPNCGSCICKLEEGHEDQHENWHGTKWPFMHKFKRPVEMRDGPFNEEVANISDELYNYIVKLEKLYEELYEEISQLRSR